MEHDDQPNKRKFIERLAMMHSEGLDMDNLQYALSEAHDLKQELLHLCNGDKRHAAIILCVAEGVLSVGNMAHLTDRERVIYKSHGREIARLALGEQESEG